MTTFSISIVLAFLLGRRLAAGVSSPLTYFRLFYLTCTHGEVCEDRVCPELAIFAGFPTLSLSDLSKPTLLEVPIAHESYRAFIRFIASRADSEMDLLFSFPNSSIAD